ncbi:MAG TPA: cell division protein SepF [Isosphaeraceae bacterium]
MASFVRRTMIYLGLADDEYEDYEHHEEPKSSAPARRQSRVYSQAEPEEATPGTIRTLTREDAAPARPPEDRPTIVRPITPDKAPRVHVVAPALFADAQEIGDRLKDDQPVIVNLQVVDRDLARRMIDFCSGLAYALSGSMEKVADQVFLLTPSDVEVSAEERQRLQERGLFRS